MTESELNQLEQEAYILGHGGASPAMKQLWEVLTAFREVRVKLTEALASLSVVRAERDVLEASFARYRAGLALLTHVRGCEECSGPNDGCEDGQELELAALETGWNWPVPK